MGSTTVLVRGEVLVVRRPTPLDADAITALVARCSAETRRRRFLGGAASIPRSYLARVCAPEHGDVHVAAVTRSGDLVALASLCDGDLGLLVEDDWQAAGIGTLLLRRLLERAAGAVTAEVGEGNARVLSWLRRLAPVTVAPQRYGWRVVLDPAVSLPRLRGTLEAAA